MMEPMQKFLNWVFPTIPPEHNIVCCYLYSYQRGDKTNTWWVHANAPTVDKAVEIFKRYIEEKREVYYAIGLFTNNVEKVKGKTVVRRTKKHAAIFHVLAFDIDCGDNKPYATQADAANALDVVMIKLGFSLNQYTIVSSGGGLHVYIRLKEGCSKVIWERTSTYLKIAFERNYLLIDSTKINDAAYVLRPVGSFNHKLIPLREVEVRRWATDTVDIDFVNKLLAPYKGAHQPELANQPSSNQSNAQGLPGKPPIALLQMEEGITWDSYQAVNSELVEQNCQQINAIAKNANVAEVLWYAVLGVAASCDQPENTAERWSSANYPEYNRSKTLAKMRQWKTRATGPTTCAYFEKINSQGCKGCTFKDAVKTPLQVAITNNNTVSDSKGNDFELPPTYYLNEDGHIVKLVNGELVTVTTYLIYLDSRAELSDIRNPINFLRFKIKRGHSWRTLEVEASQLYGAGKNEGLQGKLANAGVMLQPMLMKRVQEYLIACANLYEANKPIQRVATQMGWTSEGSFIYGVREIKGEEEKEDSITPQGTAPYTYSKAFVKKGSFDEWLKPIILLNGVGLEKHAFVYLLAYATPLVRFTTIGGAAINLYSEMTGTGKTTACHIMNSVYGNPTLLMLMPRDTDNDMFNKFSALNNLPAFIDEISALDGKRISELLYYASMGQEKGRATREGDSRAVKKWNLLLLSTSNKSLFDKLDSHESSAQGQKARLFELDINPTQRIDEIGKHISLLVQAHYGHAGEIYLRRITQYQMNGDLEDMVADAQDRFEKHFDFEFQAEERFWATIICTAWLGAGIAKELGLVPFDMERVFRVIIEVVYSSRLRLREAVATADVVLQNFIAAKADKFVKIRRVYDSVVNTLASCPRNDVLGRIEIFYNNVNDSYPESGIIIVAHEAFKKYCKENTQPYHKYMEDLKNMAGYQDVTPNLTKDVKTCIDGSSAIPIRVKAFCIPIPKYHLENFNFSREELNAQTNNPA